MSVSIRPATMPVVRRLLATMPLLEWLAQRALYWYRYVRFRGKLLMWKRKDVPLRVVVGSAGRFPKGWLPTDVTFLDLLRPQQWEEYFTPGAVDTILAEHVWEHLTPEQGLRAAQTCFQFLKPGGRLRIAVPDGRHPTPAYIEHVRVGGSGPGADDHKVLYTANTLTDLLVRAGFHPKPLEYYDADGTFHATDWDEASGLIARSARRERAPRPEGFRYTSLIVDGIKPSGR